MQTPPRTQEQELMSSITNMGFALEEMKNKYSARRKGQLQPVDYMTRRDYLIFSALVFAKSQAESALALHRKQLKGS